MLVYTVEMNKFFPSEKSGKYQCQTSKNASGCFKIWKWCCTYKRWKASCVCFKVTYTNSTKICNYWTRNVDSCICQMFHQYIYGKKVQIKLLESIMKKAMQNMPPQLQIILLTLQKYDMELKYIASQENIGRHSLRKIL